MSSQLQQLKQQTNSLGQAARRNSQGLAQFNSTFTQQSPQTQDDRRVRPEQGPHHDRLNQQGQGPCGSGCAPAHLSQTANQYSASL